MPLYIYTCIYITVHVKINIFIKRADQIKELSVKHYQPHIAFGVAFDCSSPVQHCLKEFVWQRIDLYSMPVPHNVVIQIYNKINTSTIRNHVNTTIIKVCICNGKKKSVSLILYHTINTTHILRQVLFRKIMFT